MGQTCFPQSHSATNQSVIRILVVEDHPLLRDGISALVGGQRDMQLVAQVCTGREGIEKFRTHLPDITLMDLQMPDKNGIEAIIAIRETTPTKPLPKPASLC